MLDKWNKEYFRSRFIVLSRDGNTFGGTLITILFQDRPNKVFVAWVYPEGTNKNLTLKGFDAGDFNDEDIRRIKIRYKKIMEDKSHAMQRQSPVAPSEIDSPARIPRRLTKLGCSFQTNSLSNLHKER